MGFHSSSLQTGQDAKVIGVIEHQESSADVADQLQSIADSYACVSCYANKSFVRRSDRQKPLRYAILNSHTIIGPGGLRAGFNVDCFVPAQASHPQTKLAVEVRRHMVGRSPQGEPIFPDFQIDAWRFCEDFTPDSSWMTASEWSKILDYLGPTILRDKKLAEAERLENEERNHQQNSAARARMNPAQFLAEGISSGVADALAKLNAKPA